jgi:hypothetical protein
MPPSAPNPELEKDLEVNRLVSWLLLGFTEGVLCAVGATCLWLISGEVLTGAAVAIALGLALQRVF